MATASPARTDEEIQRDVLDELKWEAYLQPNEIGVAVQDGIVTLTGWVDNYLKKYAAERGAHRVRGVKAVVNDIEVRLLGSAERTDSDIAAAAARMLRWDILVPSGKIEVTVAHGWITLRGEVNWQFQKREAERVVSRLAGVKGVINLITLRRQAKPSPEELRRQIEEALVRNAETDAQHVTVEVEDGKVILSGTVRSWAERTAAERVAWSAPGVMEVIDRLTISP